MKQFIALLLVFCMLCVLLIGCSPKGETPKATAGSSEATSGASKETVNNNSAAAHFTGKIIEVYQSGYLLKVTDPGTHNCTVNTLIAVDTTVDPAAGYVAGDYLKVTFDTSVPSVSPMKITAVISLEKIAA